MQANRLSISSYWRGRDSSFSAWITLRELRGPALAAAAVAGFSAVALAQGQQPAAMRGMNEANDLFGSAVAVGDFDGDDLADLAIGVPGENQGRGAVFILRGSNQGPRFAQMLQATNGAAGDGFGLALAAGDFDGDGRDDLAIGAPRAIPGAGNVRGNLAPEVPEDDDPPAAAPRPPAAPPRAGPLTRASSPAPQPEAPANTRSGTVFMFSGSNRGLVPADSPQLARVPGRRMGDDFGRALASGDFNGDGNDDLAVAAPRNGQNNGPRAGFVFLFRGTDDGLDLAGADPRIEALGTGARENDNLGVSMAVGDFNGDNVDDLAIGATGRARQGEPRAGTVMVLRGARGRAAFGAALALDQETDNLGTNEAADDFGAALAAGDFDGDGNDDLVVSAPGEGPGQDPRAGFVFVFRGTDAGFQGVQGLEQEIQAPQAFSAGATNMAMDDFGRAMAAGDFNGDGNDDLAVGAPGNMVFQGPRAGNAFIFFGQDDDEDMLLQPNEALTQAEEGLGVNMANERFGQALAAGDFDGDRRVDLAIGVPNAQLTGAAQSGLVQIFRGTATGLQGFLSVDQAQIGAAGGQAAPAAPAAPAGGMGMGGGGTFVPGFLPPTLPPAPQPRAQGAGFFLIPAR